MSGGSELKTSFGIFYYADLWEKAAKHLVDCCIE